MNIVELDHEGRRGRKRRETRARIAEAALTLFLDHGFDGTTIDDIAVAADISKRSFFDYFPTKEDVLAAWQDSFGEALAAAVAARPVSEMPVVAAREAMVQAIANTARPRDIAIDQLVAETPALAARDYLNYARLERVLAEALAQRVGHETPETSHHILAMIMIGSLRIGTEAWRAAGRPGTAETSARDFTDQLANVLREFGLNPA